MIEVPSCLAASNIISTISLGLLSGARAKKVPCAPSTSSPGLKGCSIVPCGEDLVIAPIGVVGEY